VVSPDSGRVSRVRTYSGTCLMVNVFRIRGYHPMLLIFPDDSAKHLPLNVRPYNPEEKTLRFRLFPFRSPLLGESRLISFPLPTEMCHFGRCRFLNLCIQLKMAGCYSHRVAPFGILRVAALYQLAGDYRRLTRPSSPYNTKASVNSS
jgi:hypothetical protein